MKLVKRVSLIARYFFLEDSFRENLEKHKQLEATQHPFVNDKLISAKTPLLYLRNYVSNALPISKKLEILNHHYTFLKNICTADKLKHLFVDGFTCYTEKDYKILLTGSKDKEREGSLSLYLKKTDVNMATLSFTISGGKTFGIKDENVVVISRIQQGNAGSDNIKETKKDFQDIMPTVVLFNVLEAICVALNIKSVLGIHGKDQLSYDILYDRSYTANYDEFWAYNGGTDGEYGYMMNCPFPKKDLLEIKQTHRNRAKKKRDRLEVIYNYCYNEISKLLSAAGIIMMYFGFI